MSLSSECGWQPTSSASVRLTWEFLTLCAPWHRSSVEVSSLGVGLLQVNAIPIVRNLCVIMDGMLNMEAHVQHLCQTSVAQLKNITDVRWFINQDSAERLVHVFITSQLDYCNALLYGLPATSLQKLQCVQNMAVCVLTGTRRHKHITPMLHQLHWLPMQYCMLYKIALLIYNTLHGEAPGYLSGLLAAPRSVCNLCSNHTMSLCLPGQGWKLTVTGCFLLQSQLSGTAFLPNWEQRLHAAAL